MESLGQLTLDSLALSLCQVVTPTDIALSSSLLNFFPAIFAVN